ncbi:MAG: esterase family protein [Armatimonadetes bacterium]|nr:esterase family protein [Armatimonadota bacterium]
MLSAAILLLLTDQNKGQAEENYPVPKEAVEQPGVPKGRMEQQPRLTSQVFGGTWHDWWVYTSANLDPAKESNLVVFQDGQWSHSYAPVFFDNLVAQGDLPQTVAVFVTPGTFTDGKSDRSREYDTLSDAYSRFLLDELLPLVEAKYKITHDPMRRCAAGLSSGGICSFTVAWHRPDKFGLVMSWIGSFTNIASGESKREGGHNYPALIRKTEKKLIRVFLQDGENDLDNEHGNWWLSNQQMAKALQFKGYELMTVWGKGGHSDKQGRAVMADALRWLFQTKPKESK